MENNVINKKFSRYTQGGTTYVSIDDKVKWWDRIVLAKSDDDLTVEIIPRFNRRPERMAYELDGKTELFWLILQYNTIIDINKEFITGKFVKVPSPTRVIFDVINKPTSGTQEEILK